ncbi:TonB-dependent siderophore receptor [Brucella pseudogrignonensis]
MTTGISAKPTTQRETRDRRLNMKRMALVLISSAVLPVSACMVPSVAFAQTSNTGRTIDFHIPSQPLASALSEFMRLTDWSVGFTSQSVAGKKSSAVNGSMTPAQALRAMLVGTDISVETSGPATVALVVASAGNLPIESAEGTTVLSTITVEGESPWGPVAGIVASKAATATKTGTSLRDIPQAINVVTRDQMDKQGVESIVQALRYTPGVVTQYGDTDVRYDWLTIRGFRPARYLDGLRLPFGARGYAQPRVEPFGLERAEVLKGPASVLYGQGLPGGMVNMVSKRPRDEEIREIELQVGKDQRYQTAFDFGGRANESGSILYRMVGVGRIADTQYDYVTERKGSIAPSLTFKPDEGTSFTLLGQYQKIDSKGGGGAPALTANGTLYTGRYPELPRSAFLGEPGFDRYVVDQALIGYEFSHDVNAQWTIKQNLRYSYVKSDSQRVAAVCLAGMACDPAALYRYAWAFPETSRLLTVDNQAIGKFSTGAADHTLLFGLDYSLEKSDYDESALAIITTPFNVYDPVFGRAPISRPPTAMNIRQNRSQIGLYAQDQIAWDRFVFSLGGRYDWASTETRTRNYTTTGVNEATVDPKDRKFTWRAGVVYNFDNGLSPYAGYSTSFNPENGTDYSGNPFAATTGEQYEIGVKYQPVGMESFVTLSAYQLTQQNVLTPDPQHLNNNIQTGEVRIRGVELEGKAQITNAMSLIASYAYTDSDITRDNVKNGVSNQGHRLNFVPEHQASLWLDYTVQSSDAWGGLSLGGGARYMGQTYGDTANTFDIPSFTLFDAAIRYDFGKADPQLKGLQASVNVSNLFDKKYVSSCIAATGCYWGEGRTVYGTLKKSW